MDLPLRDHQLQTGWLIQENPCHEHVARNTLVLHTSIEDVLTGYQPLSEAFGEWNGLKFKNLKKNISLSRLTVRSLEDLPFLRGLQKQHYRSRRWDHKLFMQNDDHGPFDTLGCILKSIGLAERVENTENCFITGETIQSHLQGRLVIPFLDHEPIEVSLCLHALARSSPHESCFVTGLDTTRYVRTTNHVEVHAIPLHPSYHRLITYCLNDEVSQAKFTPNTWPVHFMKPVYWQHR